jgi:hypothetical protein
MCVCRWQWFLLIRKSQLDGLFDFMIAQLALAAAWLWCGMR